MELLKAEGPPLGMTGQLENPKLGRKSTIHDGLLVGRVFPVIVLLKECADNWVD